MAREVVPAKLTDEQLFNAIRRSADDLRIYLQEAVDRGWTQKKIGNALGIVQQAVSYQMKQLQIEPAHPEKQRNLHQDLVQTDEEIDDDEFDDEEFEDEYAHAINEVEEHNLAKYRGEPPPAPRGTPAMQEYAKQPKAPKFILVLGGIVDQLQTRLWPLMKSDYILDVPEIDIEDVDEAIEEMDKILGNLKAARKQYKERNHGS
jgi:predicted transcriptional regulator